MKFLVLGESGGYDKSGKEIVLKRELQIIELPDELGLLLRKMLQGKESDK